MPFEDLGSVQDILKMSASEASLLYQRFLNPYLGHIIRFMGMNQRFVEAKGAYLRDDKGQEYLDFLSGFGAVNLGHEPEEVLEALHLTEERPNILQSGLNPFAAKLGQYLAEVTPGALSRSFFCNSGAEAVEAAIKLARIATRRKVLLYTEGAYHGKTFGALSVSGRKKYREPFEPLLPGTEAVPYNDAKALEKRLAKKDVAGFIVEPIQGENGVIVPDKGYLKQVERLTRQYGTLFLADEIQTGMGRTGKLFCVEHENVEPDVLILSKSLGGGVMPIGAIVTTDAIWKKAYGTLETGLLHTSTFGGNSRACACGVAAIRTIIQKRLPENAAVMGERIAASISKLSGRFSVLRGVRGKGLMIGLTLARLKGKASLAEGALTLWVARQMLKRHRIITAFTLNNLDVLRIAPPLTVGEKEISHFLTALEDVLQSAEKFQTFRLVKAD